MKVKPKKNCKWCYGSGVVYESVPYGSTSASMESLCECVEDQLPEDYDSDEIEIEIDSPGELTTGVMDMDEED